MATTYVAVYDPITIFTMLPAVNLIKDPISDAMAFHISLARAQAGVALGLWNPWEGTKGCRHKVGGRHQPLGPVRHYRVVTTLCTLLLSQPCLPSHFNLTRIPGGKGLFPLYTFGVKTWKPRAVGHEFPRIPTRQASGSPGREWSASHIQCTEHSWAQALPRGRGLVTTAANPG